MNEHVETATTAASSLTPRHGAAHVCLSTAALYLLYALLVAVFNHWAPSLSPVVLALFGCASTIGYLLILVLVIRQLTLPMLTAAQEAGLAGGMLLLYLGLNPAVWLVGNQLWHGHNFWQAVNALSEITSSSPSNSFWNLWFLSAFPFCLILAGVFFGRLVSRIIKESALLVPVGIIAALVDIWGVYWGPVNVLSNKAPMAVSAIGSAATVATRVPEATIHHLSAPLAYIAQITPPDSIGMGDFVFLALFLACAVRLGFSAKRTMWGIFIALLCYCLLTAIKGLTIFGHRMDFGYLPGLVFISGGMLLANLRSWKLTRQEWAMTGGVSLLILLLIVRSVAASMVHNSPPANPPIHFQVSAPSGPEALKVAIAHLAREPHAPPILRIYRVAFIYQLTVGGAQLVQWQARVLGLPNTKVLKQCYEYDLKAALAAPNKWDVMEDMDCPPLGILQQLKLPKDADPLAALLQLPSVPPAAYTLLARAPEYASLVKGQQGFIILLTADGGKLLTLSYTPKEIKPLLYAK